MLGSKASSSHRALLAFSPGHSTRTFSAQSARAALQAAVHIAPADARLWNALALAERRAAVQQHCLVRATQLSGGGGPALGCFVVESSCLCGLWFDHLFASHFTVGGSCSLGFFI